MREERGSALQEAAGVARVPGEANWGRPSGRPLGWREGHDAQQDAKSPEVLGEARRGGYSPVLLEPKRTIECVVCRRPHIARSSRSRTCSPECALIYPRVRYHLDDEVRNAHRKAQAKVILARPDRYRTSQVGWAERMLSDDPPPPNRTFTKTGSSVEGLLRKVERARRSVERELARST